MNLRDYFLVFTTGKLHICSSPRWKIMRQMALGTAYSQNIKNCVKYFSFSKDIQKSSRVQKRVISRSFLVFLGEFAVVNRCYTPLETFFQTFPKHRIDQKFFLDLIVLLAVERLLSLSVSF